KLLEAAVDDHRQMRLAMLVADIDGLFDAIVFQRLSHARSELARLLLRRGISQITLDHDRDRINGHDQENDYHRDRHGAHVLDHFSNRKFIAARCRGRTWTLQKKEKKAHRFRSQHGCQNSHSNSSKNLVTSILTGSFTERWRPRLLRRISTPAYYCATKL